VEAAAVFIGMQLWAPGEGAEVGVVRPEQHGAEPGSVALYCRASALHRNRHHIRCLCF
jgi:hypothetical protein